MKQYVYLEKRSDKRSNELFVRGTGVRASTVWHDRYMSRCHPAQIAEDRDISVEAVREALVYCQENWESICREKDQERQQLEGKGFFEQGSYNNP